MFEMVLIQVSCIKDPIHGRQQFSGITKLLIIIEQIIKKVIIKTHVRAVRLKHIAQVFIGTDI